MVGGIIAREGLSGGKVDAFGVCILRVKAFLALFAWCGVWICFGCA